MIESRGVGGNALSSEDLFANFPMERTDPVAGVS